MNRVRWFSATIPMSLRSIANKIADAALQVDGDMGFRVERVRGDAVSANYYEKFSWTDSGVDPFGREFSFERVGYKVVRFVLSKTYPELEIVNAPRGLTSLFSRIAELTDFQAAIEPLTVDVLSWATNLQTSYLGSLRVSSIGVSNLGVEDSITGVLTVSSRDKDVRAAATQMLSKRAYSVQKLQVVMRSQISGSSLVLTSDGGVKSATEIEPEILDIVRRAIPA